MQAADVSPLSKETQAYLMKLSLVANDRVSLFSFCSKPDPMPKATDCTGARG